MVDFASIIGAAPELKYNPGLAYSLSQNGATPDQVDQTSGAALLLKRIGEYNNNHEARVKVAIWNHLSPSELAGFQAAGIQQPTSGSDKPKGLFGLVAKGANAVSTVVSGVVNAVPGHDYAENAVGAGVGAVGTVVKEPLGLVADAASAGANALDHAYRAAYRADNEMGAGFSFSKFTKAWRDTEYGAKTFVGAKLDELRSELDTRTFDLAKRAAEGATANDLMTDMQGKTPEQSAEYLTFIESPAFAKAVQKMKDAHSGFGRVWADRLGIKLGSKPFKYVSGSLDALADWYTDPINMGAKAAKASKIAKFGITELGGAARMEKVLTQPGARRYGAAVVEELQKVRSLSGVERGAAAANLATRYPAVRGLVDGMLKAGVKNYEDYGNFLLDSRSAVALMTGRAGHQVALVPHLSKFGEAATSVKGRLNVIDFTEQAHRIFPSDLIDSANKFIPTPGETAQAIRDNLRGKNAYRGRWASVARRLSAKTWTSTKIDLDDPKSWLEARKFAMAFLPKYHADQVGAAWLAADAGGRRTIFEGIYDQMGEVAFNKSAATRDWWAAGKANSIRQTAYSPLEDAGKVLRAGETEAQSAALYTGQFRNYVSAPSFRDMYAQAARVGVMDSIGGATGIDNIDKFMHFFKRNVLLTPTLLYKNAGEEAAAHIAVYGVGDYLRARATLRDFRKNGPAAREAARVVDTMFGHAPEAVKAAVTGVPNPVGAVKLVAQHLYDRVLFGIPGGDKLLRRADWKEALDEFAPTMTARRIFDESISQIGRGPISEEAEIADRVGRGAKMRSAVMRAGGNYGNQSAAGMDGLFRWRHALNEIAQSPGGEGEVALRHIGDPQGMFDALVKHMNSPAFKPWLKQSQIGTENGVEEWAEQIVRDVTHHVSDPQGNVLEGITNAGLFTSTPAVLRGGEKTTEAMFNPEAFSLANLSGIPNELRPTSVIGQDWLGVSSEAGLLETVQRTGFATIGEYSNTLTRQPIFLANIVHARAKLRASGMDARLIADLGEEAGKKVISEHVAQTAMQLTLDAVDNDNLRSQASVIMRNVIPFWRAQEEFYTRWARITKHSPEALRKAQLTLHGGRGMGWVKTDPETGDDYLFYPTAAIVKAAGIVGIKVPQTLQFTGQIRLWNPGLDPKGVLPSFSPIVAVSLNDMAHRFPELTGLTSAALGQGAGRSTADTVFGAVMPSVLKKSFTALGWIGSQEQLGSAMLQAVQYMDANNMTPSDTATPIELDKAKDRAHDIARNIVMMRAVLGSFVPSPQREDLSGKPSETLQMLGLRTMKAEFQQLIQSTGDYTKALDIWIRVHPDDMAFTQGTTKSSTVANVPMSEQALSFFKKNEVVARQFPAVFGWLIPQAGTDKFSFDAYRELQARGLRTQKSYDEMYTALKVTAAMGPYQVSRTAKEAALHDARAASNSLAVAKIEKSWADWKDQYMIDHPQLAASFATGDERSYDRQLALRQLEEMLKTPDLPNQKSVQALRSMVDAYNSAQLYKAKELPGQDDWSRLKRNTLDDNLDKYLQTVADSDPAAKGAYNLLFSRLD